MRKAHKLLLCLTIVSIQGCSANYLTKTPYQFSQLPGWNSGDQIAAYGALENSCKVILNTNDERQQNEPWLQACKAIVSHQPSNDQNARKLIEQYFKPYRLKKDGESPGHFTGYYQPTIKGSPVKTATYNVPIYKRPANLVRKRLSNGSYKLGMYQNNKFVPYYTRKEIADGNLFSKNDIIAWVANRIERSFLQIQGSGRIVFPNGKSILVGYSAQSGQPYRPIGRYLLEHNEIPRDDITMQSIKEWLYKHPAQADTVLNYDPSFVFFKILPQRDPVGAQGIELTPEVSLAVDHRYTRYGTPIWVSTTYKKPDGETANLQKLMIAQDTGGAIRGPNRADVYWGHGKFAEYVAGHMNSKGEMWVLLPK